MDMEMYGALQFIWKRIGANTTAWLPVWTADVDSIQNIVELTTIDIRQRTIKYALSQYPELRHRGKYQKNQITLQNPQIEEIHHLGWW